MLRHIRSPNSVSIHRLNLGNGLAAQFTRLFKCFAFEIATRQLYYGMLARYLIKRNWVLQALMVKLANILMAIILYSYV